MLNSENSLTFLSRLEQLEESTLPLWGKMNAAEMLQHCRKGLEYPLGKFKLNPHPLFKLIFGRWIRNVVLSDKKFKPNSPTNPNFKVHNKGLNFESEKMAFIEALDAFNHLEDDTLAKTNHELFGRLSAAEWRHAQWKHLDHHWSQFGI